MATFHARSAILYVGFLMISLVFSRNYVVLAVTDSEDSGEDITPLSSIDAAGIVGIFIIGIGMALASAGGVGGGSICVPVLILLMNFDIKHATAASNVVVMGGAIANAIVNMQKRHPLHELVDRPLVDPDLMLGMIPPVVGGAVIGAILSKLLPAYIISLLFVVLLIAGAIKTMHKAMQLHKKEVAARKAESENAISLEIATSPTPFTEVKTPIASSPVVAAVFECEREVDGDRLEETDLYKTVSKLDTILETEKHFSWFKHSVIAFCYLGILAATIGQAAETCGSVTYWVLMIGEIPWVIGFSVFFVIYMTKSYATKQAVNYPFAPGDVQWNRKTVVWFPLICVVAGVVAGLFGIGGGIITGPMMIEIGVIPQVAAATTALMILYGSVAAATKYAVFEMIKWDWALVISVIAFVVTLLSQFYIGNYIRRTRRESIVVFCIALSTTLGAIFMAYQAIKSTIDQAGDPFTVDFCA